jgi:predicted MPP superfamily phosphohydrolase
MIYRALSVAFEPRPDLICLTGDFITRQIHVTRGVGAIAGVRFLCRPEVSLLLLQ